ncbi:aminopeptidase PaaP [Plantactinospora mayteni]|uniref:Aminopeptidase n=1 Tax=Plantactinospora mayteni TaxID=566021 RepID=A0ABQ4ER50_9ACTN|nr:M28 family peptidase [Plantactinospora mayteni]GIG97131.1 aminopeptidase [Plantactinospora mayteni]
MPSRPRSRLVLAAGIALLLVPGLASPPARADAAGGDPGLALGWERAVTTGGLLRYARQLQEISDAHGGDRAAGTAGHDASASYVARILTDAGYQVTVQTYDFPVYSSRPALRPVGTPWPEPGRDFSVMHHSPAADLAAPVHPVDLTLPPGPVPNTSTSGCEAEDFTGFPAGRIALVQRGTCNYRVKALNAAAAGAVGMIAFNEGQPDRLGPLLGSLSGPGVPIPVFSAGYALGARLAERRPVVGLRTDAVTETRPTSNVVAQTGTGDPDEVVMLGTHLDTPAGSPGLNSSGSGSAVLLELAVRLADLRPPHAVRFAWWSSHAGYASGATHYAYTLPPAEVDRIAAYLNADSLASPNHVSGVLDGSGHRPELAGRHGRGGAAVADSARIERLLRGYLSRNGHGAVEVALSGRFDSHPFAVFGVPVGGLFGGAEGIKTRREQRMFGGRAGAPYDPCHGRACDVVAHLDPEPLTLHAEALAYTAGVLAARPAGPGRE